jgi:hypothetical protein
LAAPDPVVPVPVAPTGLQLAPDDEPVVPLPAVELALALTLALVAPLAPEAVPLAIVPVEAVPFALPPVVPGQGTVG